MAHHAGEILNAVIRRLLSDWKPLFGVHLAWVALGFALLAPLTGFLIRFLIGLSGHQVLADQDIAWFLLSPFGLAAMILVIAVIIAISALEQASLMAVGTGHLSGRRLPVLDALAFAAARSARTLLLAAHLVARVLITLAPFIVAGAAVAWILITDHDINYYLQARPPEFWIAATVIGILLTVALVLVTRKLIAWSLVLPLVLFLDVSPARSFGESARLTAGRRSLVLRVMVAWGAAVLVLGMVVLGVIQVLGSRVVPFFHDSLSVLVVVLGAILAAWFLANLVLTAFNAASFGLAILELSERLVPGLEAAERTQSREPAAGFSPRLTVPGLAVVLVAGVGVAVLAGFWLLNGIEVRDTTTIVAHRGAAGKAPENTMASAHQAIEDGADWVEIDVQESADGEVVVIHDSDFMKLANVDLKVWDGTAAQIASIDVGSWFDPAFSDERVPTLREVLAAVRGKAGVVIELKYYGHDEKLEQRVADIVDTMGMASDVAVMSLDYAGVLRMRALRPDWAIGLLSATAIGDLTRLDADFLAVNRGMATPAFVRHAQDNGKQLYVWTVNDPVSMSRMMSIGVDGIITDEPEMARRVMEERAELTPVERLLVHAAVVFGQPVPPRSYRDDSP
jgi:glycerophosphoryl diester phosphodiesterase